MKKEKYRETFEAIVEIDKTYIGGKPCKHNNHKDNKPKRGCNTFKTPVVSVKKRNIRKVHMVVANYNDERKLLSGKQLQKMSFWEVCFYILLKNFLSVRQSHIFLASHTG